MENISERIAILVKELKSAKHITQSKMAEQLNVSQTHISKMAAGKSFPSERTIVDICEKFNVNEVWLRTGEGDMFVEVDKDVEFDRICAEIQLSNDEFIKDIMRKYWGLDESEKEIVRYMLSGLSGK